MSNSLTFIRENLGRLTQGIVTFTKVRDDGLYYGFAMTTSGQSVWMGEFGRRSFSMSGIYLNPKDPTERTRPEKVPALRTTVFGHVGSSKKGAEFTDWFTADHDEATLIHFLAGNEHRLTTAATTALYNLGGRLPEDSLVFDMRKILIEGDLDYFLDLRTRYTRSSGQMTIDQRVHVVCHAYAPCLWETYSAQAVRQ